MAHVSHSTSQDHIATAFHFFRVNNFAPWDEFEDEEMEGRDSEGTTLDVSIDTGTEGAGVWEDIFKERERGGNKFQ